MKTFNRKCIKSYKVKAENGDSFSIKKGREYLTSDVRDGKVCVFTNFWVWVPLQLFKGAQQFTW